MKYKIKTSLILFIFTLVSYSQSKNEKEERVENNEFPEQAQELILKLPKDTKRLKFYKETDGDKLSYEAKFKLNGRRHSLEFSDKGVIEDLEIKIKFKRIEKTKRTDIQHYFKVNFKKYKIIKVQEQFIFEPSQNAEEFLNLNLNKNPSIQPNYEIIAEVKQDNERSIREFTFDTNGNLLGFRIVNTSSYEHVLY